MATDDRESTRQTVYEDLTARLQHLRRGVHADAMARALLQYVEDDAELVALREAGKQAVVFDPSERTVEAVPVDEHGVDEFAAEQLWTGVADPATWVDAHTDDVAWVHPDYRWVLDGDYSTWVIE